MSDELIPVSVEGPVFLDAQRVHEYRGRLYVGGSRSSIFARHLSDKVSERLGVPAFFSNQIRTIAHLLGFEDDSFDLDATNPPGPHQITSGTFNRQIVGEMPEGTRIGIRTPEFREYLKAAFPRGAVYQFGDFVYRESGVITALDALDGKGRLVYAPGRYAEAKEIALHG